MMEEKKHQTVYLYFRSYRFVISQPQLGTIRIDFEDIRGAMTYTTKKELTNVSYKTVLSALRESEPDIIKAVLIPLVDHEYELKIKVSLEYLNEIEQIFIFRGERMSEQKVKSLQSINKLGSSLNQLKTKIKQANRSCLTSGTIPNHQQPSEILIDIPYKTTIISLFLQFKNYDPSVMKTSFKYYDEVSKRDIDQNLLPDELYLENSANIAIIANRGIYRRGVFKIQGNFSEMEYSVKLQSAVNCTPYDYTALAKVVIKLLIGYGILVFVKKMGNYIGLSGGEVSPQL